MVYNPQNILITGGCGFIGTNFIRYLLKKYKDITIVNVDKLTYAGNLLSLKDISEKYKERYYFYREDIINSASIFKIMERHHVDTIVNFAAESHVDRSILNPEIFLTTNTLGTLRLLEVARNFWGNDNNVRFHHISTDEVYGSLKDHGKFSENSCYKPSSPYSASKAGADHFVYSYYRTFNLPITITNSSNNYGPYQFPEKLIPLTIINCLNHKRIPIYGKGENIRNWLFVEDHCEGIDVVIRKGEIGESYNIASNDELKNIVLVENICKILDEIKPSKKVKSYSELISFVEDRPGHDYRYALSFDKVKKLGWTPKTSMEKGLQKTVMWYVENENWWRSILNQEYIEFYEKWYGGKNLGEKFPQ